MRAGAGNHAKKEARYNCDLTLKLTGNVIGKSVGPIDSDLGGGAPSIVTEPGMLPLLAIGLLGFGIARCKLC